MKRILSFVASVVCSSLLFTSCMKEEKPYAIPQLPIQEGAFEIKNNQVHMGETYETQVFFNFNSGIISTGSFKVWDISFSTDPEKPELWMNGGKQVLIHPTGKSDYASVLSTQGISAKSWKYDHPSGLSGQSGLGILTDQNYIGEVLIVDIGEDVYYKLQILEITPTSYKIKTGLLESTLGEETTLTKDDNYNYAFFSFANGIVKPEPPKKEWDIVFTRYRHIYYEYEPDGSDFLYYLNGVLTNPYKTTSGDDSLKRFDFYLFSLEDAANFKMNANRDEIGFDWKNVDINTGKYTVNARRVFLIKDQHESLWKMRFVSFYDDNNVKGSPKFEFQRLK